MKNNIAIIIAGIFLVSCKSTSQTTASVQLPADKNATPETVVLYQNLFKAREKGYMFGHQDALAYGVNWRYEEGRSDIKDVTGDYPAVYGWDLGRIENKEDKDLDGVPFSKQKHFVETVYNRGGVNTFSWHMNNPLTGKDAWNNEPGTVASVLPGGAKHELFKSWLDNAAAYFLTLKGKDGKLVPILFRPYHEFTGNWFWWCKNTTTPEQFKALWKFTVNYFESKGVHNLLYVYNTSDANVQTKADFMEYYPGDEYVDMVSFDIYQGGEEAEKREKFAADTHRLVGIIDEVATEHHKLSSIAETGFEQIPYATWWTETLTNAIGNRKISYVLVWRNHGWNEYVNPPHMHYYAPYKGHKYEADFIKYYKQPETLFQKEVTKFNLYKK
ncbi:glycoside hydrolase family 26 protein [Flavobacterium sp. RHBU_3]|uniref:glycoside hydrolase family 26 protein n=1 Tax=Flavobacterium sp. RHBU_3 TaxID=3391184 RepID=UPI00398533C7